MHAGKSQSSDLCKFQRPHLPNVSHGGRFATGLNLLSFILCLHRGVTWTKCHSCKMFIFNNEKQTLIFKKIGIGNLKKGEVLFIFVPLYLDWSELVFLLLVSKRARFQLWLSDKEPAESTTHWSGISICFCFEQFECAATSDCFPCWHATLCFESPCWLIVWNKLYLPSLFKTPRLMSLHQTRRRLIKQWRET